FTTIDWSAGPYYIETAVDVNGGTSYDVMGTSQLMSVPYALYAKTSGNGQGPVGPQGATGAQGPQGPAGNDGAVGATGPQGPVGNDGAVGATGPQGPAGNDGAVGATGLQGPQGITGATGPAGIDAVCCNTIDSLTQLVSTLDSIVTVFTSQIIFGCTDTLADNYNSLANFDDGTCIYTPVVLGCTDSTALNYNPLANTDDGSCTYTPQYPGGSVFCSSGPTAIVDVTNPVTGKTWMDRNLGATQAATSSNDALSYGDLYQWGRRSDGHQCRNSPSTTTLSSTDQPVHGNFITAQSSPPYDWRSPQNDNLWQGVNGVNNPCPSGYRLPTEIEMNEEVLSWSSNDPAGAFASPLKWTLVGYRSHNSANINTAGGAGNYHTSTVDGTLSSYLSISSNGGAIYAGARASGSACRCIKD
ncbi:collagen-like protein, partial [Crocinitomicaceae bacterium]|nr:collagen-like protein [Crocinitomicaceae bacterium]